MKKPRVINFGGKNRRFYASTGAMLALILAPFGMYAALNAGEDGIAGLLFAVMTGSLFFILLLG